MMLLSCTLGGCCLLVLRERIVCYSFVLYCSVFIVVYNVGTRQMDKE